MNTLRETFRIRAPEPARAVRFSPDGHWLVVLPQSGRSVRVYERAGSEYHDRGSLAGLGLRRSSILNVEFHPTGALVVTGESHRIEVWDLAARRLLREFGSYAPAEPGRVIAYEGLGISPDGSYVETSFLARDQGERYSWDTGELVATRWGNSGPFVFHPEGELLAVTAVDSEYYSHVQMCSWTGESYLWYPPLLVTYMAVGGAAFSPNGRVYAMVGGIDTHWCQVHSFPECTVRFRLDLGTLEELRFPYEVTEALCFVGSLLLLGRVDGTVLGVDVESSAVTFEHAAHPTRVMSIRLHPSEPWIATASQDGEVVLWEMDETTSRDEVVPGGSVTREFVESFPPFPEGQCRDPEDDLLFEPED